MRIDETVATMKLRLGVKLLLLTAFLLLTTGVFSSAMGQTPPKAIPNIFTPNGDGINDNLELQSTETMTFIVFNRNGALVYKAEAKNIIWDGKDERGNDISDGIYFFILNDPAKTYSTDRGFIYISRTSVKE